MNAESTPLSHNIKFNIRDAFDEFTPVKERLSIKHKRKYFRDEKIGEVIESDQSKEESDSEIVIKSQVLRSVKKRKGKESEKRRTDRRTFSAENDSTLQHSYTDKSHCDSKLQFLDSGIDKLLVNYDIEEIKTFKQSNCNNSKFFKNESLSNVLNCNGNSFLSETNEPSFSNIIKKKLSENIFKKEIIKSQTSGWTQYELPITQHNNDSFFGLPSKVQQLYEEHKGIKQLFEWQQECLNLDAVKLKKNLVYSLPTSGGKSLVAEILILKEILIHHKNVLLILPFVSLVQEKIRDFSPFALEFNFFLEEYAAGKGVIPLKKHRKRNSLMIATIEKGLIVINSLIETKRLEELGLIVVDELHLLSEEGRGPILETLLIQILNAQEKIQVIGMTATIGNLQEMAEFLKADTYSGDFRPVHLSEYIKCGNKIYSVDLTSEDLLKEIRTIDSHFDFDGITQLVQEIVPEDSVLIFCPTKRNCENVAASLSQYLPRSLTKFKETEKASLYRALVSEMNEKICPTLKKTLPFGVAYHHSGLTVGERKLLEEAFRQGTISIICCTSTLAAGVNLPARRVILRSPYVGKDFISLSKYKQMVGRAGRTGFGFAGDSFLICQPTDSEKVEKLFRSQMDETISKMNSDSCKHLILSSIGLETATTRKSLKELLKRSLLHNQFSKLKVETGEIVDECIKNLYKQGALTIGNKETVFFEEEPTTNLELKLLDGEKSVKISNVCELKTSRLGRAAMKGGMSLEVAHEIYGELVRAQANLVLLTNLHLLYLVTPFDLLPQIKPDFQIFFSVYMQLDEKNIHVARIIGITESVASKLVVGAKPKNVKHTVVNRFYISLILNELWNQKTIWDVAQIFQLPRGLVQGIMTSSATFANSVLRFCEELEEFWSFKSLLCEFAPRLAHCCAPELLPLMDLPAVKKGRAKQLYDAGFKTLQLIARAQASDLVRAIDHMPRNVASQIIAAAKLLLTEKAENLREEADIVLEGLTEKFVPIGV